jgi:succinate dehydrogenase/fumarate reductase flavoprotein subunit
MSRAEIQESVVRVDILVIGGGTAGTVAAIKAKEALPEVLLLEKANVKRSGAIALGMDGVNNSVVPGHATPEQYVKEITMANDGIVNQRAVLAYTREGVGMIRSWSPGESSFRRRRQATTTLRRFTIRAVMCCPCPRDTTSRRSSRGSSGKGE